jgi:nucleoside-diphosphate-sugar epimerase
MTPTVITGAAGFPLRILYDKARLELGYQPGVDYAAGLRHVSAWWRETRLSSLL